MAVETSGHTDEVEFRTDRVERDIDIVESPPVVRGISRDNYTLVLPGDPLRINHAHYYLDANEAEVTRTVGHADFTFRHKPKGVSLRRWLMPFDRYPITEVNFQWGGSLPRHLDPVEPPKQLFEPLPGRAIIDVPRYTFDPQKPQKELESAVVQHASNDFEMVSLQHIGVNALYRQARNRLFGGFLLAVGAGTEAGQVDLSHWWRVAVGAGTAAGIAGITALHEWRKTRPERLGEDSVEWAEIEKKAGRAAKWLGRDSSRKIIKLVPIKMPGSPKNVRVAEDLSSEESPDAHGSEKTVVLPAA